MSEPIPIDHIDVDLIEIREPKEQKNADLGLMFYPFYNNKKLRVTLPEMNAPFGAGPGRTEKTKNKYSMGLSFEGLEEDTKRGQRMARAYNKMVEIDNKISDLVLAEKDRFFKDTKETKVKGKIVPGASDDEIRKRYNSFIHPGKEEKYADRMYPALQLPTAKEADVLKLTGEERAEYLKTFKTMGKDYPLLVDNDGNPIHVTIDNLKDVIPWRTNIKPVLEFAYLWDAGQKEINPVWTFIHGLRTEVSERKLFDIRRGDSDDEDDNMEETVAEEGEQGADEEDMHVEEAEA